MLTRLILLFFLFSTSYAYSQESSNTDLEGEVQSILALFKERPRPLEKIRDKVYQIEEAFELDCVQKGRVFQKLGSVIYMEGNSELYPEGISVLQDSTIKVWTACDSLDTKWLWTPLYILLKFYEHENRLFEAGELMDYIDAHPEIHLGKSYSQNLRMYSLMGKLRGELGDKVAANQYFKKAEGTLDSVSYAWYKFDFLDRYGSYLYDSGKNEESLVQFEKAKDLREIAQDSLIWFDNIISPLLKLKKYEELENIIQEHSYLASDTMQSLNYRSYAYYQMSRYFIEVDSLEKANDILTTMEALVGDNPDNRTMKSDFLRTKAKVLSTQNKFAKADQAFKLAINSQVLNPSDEQTAFELASDDLILIDYETLILTLEEWFDSKLYEFQITGDHAVLDQGLGIVDQLSRFFDQNRSELMSEYSKLSQLESSYNVFERAIKVCVNQFQTGQDQAYLKKAIDWSVRHKSSILSGLNSSKQIFKNTLTENEYVQLAELEQSKREVESLLITSDGFTEDLNEEYMDSRSQDSKFKNHLYKHYPELKSALNLSSQIMGIDDIKSNLKRNQMLLDFFFGDDDLFVFFISRNGLGVEVIPVDKELNLLFDRIESDLYGYSNLDQLKQNAQKLYDKVFDDHMFIIKDNFDELIVLPDGRIHNVPLEMFWDGRKYLIEKFDISYLFGCAKLGRNNHKHYDDYLGFGTKYNANLNYILKQKLPELDISLPELSYTEEEIANSSRTFRGMAYANQEATRSNFINHATGAKGIIHTALHGLVLNENVSCLLFDDSESDLILKSTDVYDLDLQNELTILSACYSSSGKIYKGEGVRNLARSFLFAGSQSVMPSLWASSDISNSELMGSFFKNLKQSKEASSSLALSKRQYIKNASPAYSHPAYWANMILVDQLDSKSNTLLKWGIGLMVLCALAFGFLFFRK